MKKFRFKIIGESVLGVEDIWPDGNAPEKPTFEDIKKILLHCGSVDFILRAWNMVDDFAWEISEENINEQRGVYKVL